MSRVQNPFVRGIFHPKPRKAPLTSHRDYYLYDDEIEEALKMCIGKPVCVEHNLDQVVGMVKRVFTFNENPYMMHTEGVIKGLRSGYYKGLSLHYDANKNEYERRVSKIVPREISIVKRGAIEGSNIVSHGYSNHIFISRSGSLSLYDMEKQGDMDELQQFVKQKQLTVKQLQELMEENEKYRARELESFKDTTSSMKEDIQILSPALNEKQKKEFDNFIDLFLDPKKQGGKNALQNMNAMGSMVKIMASFASKGEGNFNTMQKVAKDNEVKDVSVEGNKKSYDDVEEAVRVAGDMLRKSLKGGEGKKTETKTMEALDNLINHKKSKLELLEESVA